MKRRLIGGSDSLGSADSPPRQPRVSPARPRLKTSAVTLLPASDIAQGVEGAKSVKNDLQVVTPAARQAVDANDKDIAKAVETRLSQDSQLKKVDVRTDAGVVTLTGQVATIVASAKASEMARGVPGVRSVKNQLAFAK